VLIRFERKILLDDWWLVAHADLMEEKDCWLEADNLDEQECHDFYAVALTRPVLLLYMLPSLERVTGTNV
jgi:hypothetical protein